MTIKLFIDAGHNPGNINAGAIVEGIEEQAINFTVTGLRHLYNHLRKSKTSNRLYLSMI